MRTRYFNAFRLASYLLVLYTLGHTFGAVIGTPQFGIDSDAVVTMMKSVHVHPQSADCTWYGFYRGFGALVSVYFVVSFFLAWHLGGMRDQDRPALMPVAWTLFLGHLAGVVIAWVYFFPVPIVLSTVITALLGFGCIGQCSAPSRATSTRLG